MGALTGRPKGTPNKLGAAVKSNVVAVFDQIGGRDKMAEWAKENLGDFYKLYARLIPTEIIAQVDMRDANEYSDDELLAIAASGSARAALPAPSVTEPAGVH